MMNTPSQTPNLPAISEARIVVCANGQEITVAGTTLRYRPTPESQPAFFNQQTEARAAKLLEVLVRGFGGEIRRECSGAVETGKGGAN